MAVLAEIIKQPNEHSIIEDRIKVQQDYGQIVKQCRDKSLYTQGMGFRSEGNLFSVTK